MKTLTQPRTDREEIVATVIADPPVGIGLRRFLPKDVREGEASYVGDCPACGEADKFTLTISIPGGRILYGCYKCRYMTTPKGQVPRPGIDYHEMLRDPELVIYPGDFIDEDGYVFPGELPKPKPSKQEQLGVVVLSQLEQYGSMGYQEIRELVEGVSERMPGMKVSERMLYRAIERLEKGGKIERQRERRPDGTYEPVSYSLVEEVGFDYAKYVPEGVRVGVG